VTAVSLSRYIHYSLMMKGSSMRPTPAQTKRIAVLGAGAMGCLFGGRLAKAGNDVTMIDSSPAVVEALRSQGLRLTQVSGPTEVIPIQSTQNPAEVGPVDWIIVLVKGQHTEAAMRSGQPLLGTATHVLTLQNGWGNTARLAAIAGAERVLAGVTLHSVTVLEPGQVEHTAQGETILGELDGRLTPRLQEIFGLLESAQFGVSVSESIRRVIWSKLALNVCALPACSLLRFRSGQLLDYEPTLSLMRALLREVVAVANAQGIELDFEERWNAITGQLERARNVRASMLQDVEKRRQTEIHTITGAVVEAGRHWNVPTPCNETLFWLIRALEESFETAPIAVEQGHL